MPRWNAIDNSIAEYGTTSQFEFSCQQVFWTAWQSVLSLLYLWRVFTKSFWFISLMACFCRIPQIWSRSSCNISNVVSDLLYLLHVFWKYTDNICRLLCLRFPIECCSRWSYCKSKCFAEIILQFSVVNCFCCVVVMLKSLRNTRTCNVFHFAVKFLVVLVLGYANNCRFVW